MRKHKIVRSLWIATALCALASVLVGAPVSATDVAPQPVAPLPASVVYDLWATDGYWIMADTGYPLYSYGFIGGREGQPFTYLDSTGNNVTATAVAPSPGANTAFELQLQGNAQFPAPLIYCARGQTVTLKLKNLGVKSATAPNDPHSIHLHGMDVDAANDGVPETSVAAVPANLTDAGGAPYPGAGNVVYYMFTPTREGTYFFHCHQEADIHVTMGMYGALIVYGVRDQGATKGPGFAGNEYGFRYDKDYVMLLSDTDVRQHQSEEALPGAPDFNPVDYTPQYWFINALSFPNTVGAGIPGFNYAKWLSAHPGYQTLISGKTTGGFSGNGEKVLVRMINMGFQTQPMHMHGFHAKVIGSDQRPWFWTLGQLEKNTVTIGSGETYDLLYNFGDQKVNSTYPPGTQSRYDPVSKAPVSNTNTAAPVIVDPTTGLVYIGGPVVSGAEGLPSTSQFFPFHNHDDYKSTNNGTYPGGMFTMLVPLP